MYRKKFVPPLLKKPLSQDNDASEPPSKKIKLESDASSGGGSNSGRRPLLCLKNSNAPVIVKQEEKVKAEMASQGMTEGYFNILWRKQQHKKHKTWDGDGILSLRNGSATLVDTDGKDLGSGRVSKPLELGDVIKVGGKDVEIDSILSREEYMTGRPFLKASIPAKPAPPPRTAFVAPKKVEVAFLKNPATNNQIRFKNPLLETTEMPKQKGPEPTPRHDPKAENALVMTRATLPKSLKGKQIVDVVVDPLLTKHLRQHQREGVAFLYEAVMGMRETACSGAILADEMGLGKTLQTIALLWTLLKQNPIYQAGPVVKKALIVCPVTLINNWRKEFQKWLGKERIGIFVLEAKNKLRDFTHGNVYSVMIVGYERLRLIQNDLADAKIDIVIADEGHRLKTAKNKSAEAIRNMSTDRKVILSGTPLQNDLTEFFVMVDFVNPGILGSANAFKKQFENPIVKSRQPEARKKDKELGEARGEELATLTKRFILRRTSEVLSKYLPPKTDYVLFCKPTPLQIEVYKAVLESPSFNRLLRSNECMLQLITLLKKACNSPSLLAGMVEDCDEEDKNMQQILRALNGNRLKMKVHENSGKLRVLSRFLSTLKENTEEKVVLVSNYTATLDILQNLCCARGYSFLRLDGKTPTAKRQELVDSFNRVDSDKAFVFLLSSKSGGAGINLIGASRLVLFDSDWNPANDLQSMARVHRDGQKSHVFIYRLLTTGCLDEKIYQRQITKQGLADSVMDQVSNVSGFSHDELRDLFSLDTDTRCNTHDLLECPCGGNGERLVFNTDENAEEIVDLVDDENEDALPDVSHLLMKASQVDMEKLEKSLKEDKASNTAMKSLLQFSHLDTQRLEFSPSSSLSFGKGDTVADSDEEEEDDEDDDDEGKDKESSSSMLDPEVVVEDEILRTIMKNDEQHSISYIFCKSS